MSDAQRRGARAKAELAETEEVLSAMRTGALEAIATSSPAHADRREHLYRTVQVIDLLRQRLGEIVSAGEYDEHIEKLLNQGEADD